VIDSSDGDVATQREAARNRGGSVSCGFGV